MDTLLCYPMFFFLEPTIGNITSDYSGQTFKRVIWPHAEFRVKKALEIVYLFSSYFNGSLIAANSPHAKFSQL